MKKMDEGRIVREGYPFIIIPGIIGLIFLWLEWVLSGILLVSFAIFCLYFFRNPKRSTPQEPGAIISPADGKVVKVESSFYEDRFLKTPMQKISIFMSVFDVHVNRFSLTGIIRRISYHPGRFVSANLDKASSENEQNVLFLEHQSGQKILIIQIAGLIARRIACWAEEGDKVEVGQRIGLIRFGSRVDLIVSPRCRLVVRQGDRVRAGETILGYLP